MILLNSNLQAFISVHENATVHGAAKKLGLSQTAVTQRIQALERELGVSLFLRSRKGMALTQEGMALLRYCVECRALEGKVLSEMKGGEVTDTEFRIAGPTSFVSGRAVPQCVSLYRKWPKLNLQFAIDDRENRIDLIKKGDVDLVALQPHQIPLELDSKVLAPDEYILVGSASWKKRSLKEIISEERIFAFHPGDPTSFKYLKTFGLLKFLKRPRLYVNENRALIELLVSGVGFGILTKQIARSFLTGGGLIELNEGKVLKDPLALAWYPRREMPDHMKEIIASIH